MENKKTTVFQSWLIAIRPRTLPAAPSGVIVGSALAIYEHSFRFFPALAALLIALLLQIGSNLANDVFDYERGSDSGNRLGPTRATQSGLLTPREVKIGMLVVFGLAILLGLYLAFEAGWVVIWIGLASVISAIAYTGGPFPLGYHGLGDVFVFLFFGVAAVTGTYYVQALTVSLAAWVMTVPVGLLIVSILVVNNYRDIDQDRHSGKRTLVVIFGEGFARGQYVFCVLVPFLCMPVFCGLRLIPWMGMLTWLSLWLAVPLIRSMYTQKGRVLNRTLAKTGQLVLAFSGLFFLGILISFL